METFTPEKVQKKTVEGSSSTSLNLSKVFLWMVLALGITGVVAFFLPDLLILMANQFNWSEDVLGKVYLGLTIASAILMFPSVIFLSLKAWRPNTIWMSISFIAFSVFMGVLVSSAFMVVLANSTSSADFINTVGISFFITAGAFLLMALFGFITKKTLSILVSFIMSLSVGVIIISLVNFFLQSALVYWITDFVIFGIIFVITAIDINRVKKIAEMGGFSSDTNLAIYCAYTLYVDFINIFLRVLYYVMVSKSRKDKN